MNGLPGEAATIAAGSAAADVISGDSGATSGLAMTPAIARVATITPPARSRTINAAFGRPRVSFIACFIFED